MCWDLHCISGRIALLSGKAAEKRKREKEEKKKKQQEEEEAGAGMDEDTNKGPQEEWPNDAYWPDAEAGEAADDQQPAKRARQG